MKMITISRTGSTVTFTPVSIDFTENVVFSNQDPQEPHWPTLATCTNQLGAAPSPNSDECSVPLPEGVTKPPFTVTYGCRVHPNDPTEKGTIAVYAQLAAATTTLAAATVGQAIASQQVVTGGLAPYTISGELYQITGSNPQQGAGIGPGLQLNPGTSAQGITVTGTPTVPGTYTFTFTVNDAMGRNLQQTQYTMTVSAA